MTVRRRMFGEVLDQLLTGVVGGVAGEEHPFPPPGVEDRPFRPPGRGQPLLRHQLLQPPAAQIVTLWGLRNGEAHQFRPEVDFRLADGVAIEWQLGAELPDPGSLISVTYASGSARTALNDLQAGSVVRTLAEATALEVARLYAQLDAVYRAGFVDTASDRSLDNVVALLGVERVLGDHPAGEVEFTRPAGSPGELTIPSGTRVMPPDGAVEYATTATVRMAPLQSSVRVVARDVEPNDPVPAGVLTVLPVPIMGVTGVTNPAPTARPGRDETDEELRTRAKSFLHGSERSTLGALRAALARERITADIEEGGRLDDDGKLIGKPGVVVVTPHAGPDGLAPEALQRLRAALDEVRPAGVLIRLTAPQPARSLRLELRLSSSDDLAAENRRAAQDAIRAGVTDLFARLPVRAGLSQNQLVGLVLGVPGIVDVRIVSATLEDGTDVLADDGTLAIAGIAVVLGELHLADPSLPTELDVTVRRAAAAPLVDPATLVASLQTALGALNAANAVDAGAPPVTFLELRDALGLPAGEFAVQFAVRRQDGGARLLAAAADDPYALVPFERLTVGSVVVEEA